MDVLRGSNFQFVLRPSWDLVINNAPYSLLAHFQRAISLFGFLMDHSLSKIAWLHRWVDSLGKVKLFLCSIGSTRGLFLWIFTWVIKWTSHHLLEVQPLQLIVLRWIICKLSILCDIMIQLSRRHLLYLKFLDSVKFLWIFDEPFVYRRHVLHFLILSTSLIENVNLLLRLLKCLKLRYHRLFSGICGGHRCWILVALHSLRVLRIVISKTSPSKFIRVRLSALWIFWSL